MLDYTHIHASPAHRQRDADCPGRHFECWPSVGELSEEMHYSVEYPPGSYMAADVAS